MKKQFNILQVVSFVVVLFALYSLFNFESQDLKALKKDNKELLLAKDSLITQTNVFKVDLSELQVENDVLHQKELKALKTVKYYKRELRLEKSKIVDYSDNEIKIKILEIVNK